MRAQPTMKIINLHQSAVLSSISASPHSHVGRKQQVSTCSKKSEKGDCVGLVTSSVQVRNLSCTKPWLCSTPWVIRVICWWMLLLTTLLTVSDPSLTIGFSGRPLFALYNNSIVCNSLFTLILTWCHVSDLDPRQEKKV